LKRKIYSVRFKKLVLEMTEVHGNASKVCREWGVTRSTFYHWKKTFANEGEACLIPKKPILKVIQSDWGLKSLNRFFI